MLPLVPASLPLSSGAGRGIGMDAAVLALVMPKSPCPSLLPCWLSLHLSSNLLLPLLLLQLFALEAYIWVHDRVLADMAEQPKEANASFSTTTDKDGNCNGGGSNNSGGTAARWALYALSLVAVRIAESVLSIVVWADF